MWSHFIIKSQHDKSSAVSGMIAHCYPILTYGITLFQFHNVIQAVRIHKHLKHSSDQWSYKSCRNQCNDIRVGKCKNGIQNNTGRSCRNAISTPDGFTFSMLTFPPPGEVDVCENNLQFPRPFPCVKNSSLGKMVSYFIFRH